MPERVFRFKQFSIKQERAAMKIGTDAVLLGAWTDTKNALTVLDIGTGTGIIALMIAQRCEGLIDAVDIDENSAKEAKENFDNSPWKDRLWVHHISLQNFAMAAGHKYDLIVSNPPFFIDSSKASDYERTAARHTDLLPFSDLLTGVKKLLTDKGKFCLILPVLQGEKFRDLAEPAGLHLSKLTRVRTTEDKKTEKRFLMQFEFNPTSFSENTIIIEKDVRHGYTDEYKALTGDYYIHF